MRGLLRSFLARNDAYYYLCYRKSSALAQAQADL